MNKEEVGEKIKRSSLILTYLSSEGPLPKNRQINPQLHIFK